MFKKFYGEAEPEDTEMLLPHTQGTSIPRLLQSRGQPRLIAGRRRTTKVVLGLAGISLVFFVFLSLSSIQGVKLQVKPQTADDTDLSLPPRYTAIRQHIASLPQHNLSLPFPEGSQGRYVKFSSQISQLGWNNVLNEVLMNAHLAYRSNRAYVFMDYDWKLSYYPWPEELMYEKPPKTPLGALMSGPVVGDEWPAGVQSASGSTNAAPPRAVSADYYERVCPPHKRRIISTADVKPWKKFHTTEKSGRETFDIWLSLLTDRAALDNVTAQRTRPTGEDEDDDDIDGAVETPYAGSDECIEIVPAPIEEDNYPQVFDLWLWGSDRILSLWEEFKASPIASVGLGTSAVVERCIQRNMPLFSRRSSKEVDSGDSAASDSEIGPGDTLLDDPLGRTLAVHIRRGDFKKACQSLADYNSTYYSWNQLTFLPDHFSPPPYPEGNIVGPGNNSDANVRTYISHCLPDDSAIVKKVEESRRDWEVEMGYLSKDTESESNTQTHFLETVFLLTNERDLVWLETLKSHFGGWKNVVISSIEIVYGDAQEKDVGMAVDMDLARRAAVFVGNGFSSFTSNILHRRLVDGKIPVSNRFF